MAENHAYSKRNTAVYKESLTREPLTAQELQAQCLKRLPPLITKRREKVLVIRPTIPSRIPRWAAPNSPMALRDRL